MIAHAGPHVPGTDASGDISRDAVYLYGFAPVQDALRASGTTGIGGAPVEVIADADIAAIVSGMAPGETTWAELIASAAEGADDASPSGRRGIEDAVRAHEAVLERVIAHGSVIPLRFGTLCASGQSVVDLLQSERSALEAALGLVRDGAEWGLRVSWDPDSAWARVCAAAEGARAGAESSPPHPVSAGRAYLAQRQRERDLRTGVFRLQQEINGALDERLRSVARASVVLPHRSSQTKAGDQRSVVFEGAYLVDRQDNDRWVASLRSELARGQDVDLRLEVTGPWPPYHFVDLQLGATA